MMSWYDRHVASLPLPLVLILGGPFLSFVSLTFAFGTLRCRDMTASLLKSMDEKSYLMLKYTTSIGRTENGLIGTFPGPTLFAPNRLPTLPGDSLVILEGASMPFVIRRLGDHWRLVGEAYVHGIMYGAAFERSQLVRISLC